MQFLFKNHTKKNPNGRINLCKSNAQIPYSSKIKLTILFKMGARRFSHVVKRQVYYSWGRGYVTNLLKNQRNRYIMYLIGTGIVTTMCLAKLETVPYSKRKHIVLSSRSLERKLGEMVFNKMKEKSKILPEKHPESMRVGSISKDIIESLKKAMNKEKKGSTGHFKGFKWEVVVVDKNHVNACCAPGGKIIVFRGLLKHFKSDEEIVTIIGHEVAHAVARHTMEKLATILLLLIISIVLLQFIILDPDLIDKIIDILVRLPSSRKMEMEADYIGLMLLASAGYDPRVAPEVYVKLGKVAGERSGVKNYLATHPSSKKRAQSLAQAKVMEEALDIYKEIKQRKELNSSIGGLG